MPQEQEATEPFIPVSEELHKLLQEFEPWDIEVMLREALALRQDRIDWLLSIGGEV